MHDYRTQKHLGLNNRTARASVSNGMKVRVLFPIAVASFLVTACEQKPAEPSGGQPTTPAPGATPLSSPTAAETPAASPAATPVSSPTATTPPSPPATPATSPSPSSSPSAANSEGRPTLSSQSANEYLQSYDAYINDFKMAYHAMKQGDMTKYQTVIQRARELQTKGEKLGGELSPEEQKRFADYLNKKADELAQFASQNR
jgi:hypothetical protein